ncbi:AAA family ATPase [Gymnodinialimonas ceratoperidinii]|uniref:AAA family ATPase n=1 Tax=Gymnodinialimonas ceratoperidinii TaxID=2856823 RepID=A0A8F6YA45_9RHOB|nr:AAA family ATPase [Gymnodinialimonas ceratoperidinii]QXT38586.1 AAA family ATPase [Gymnodinialimonas ceratoperidinii]
MRLRALHLGNVRKFAGKKASVTGIGDGITVVSEANEFGKSTFFDALHALFFEKYSSAAKTVKSLQPYAKGAVEVAAEIETDEGRFRVEKTFLQRKSARVLRMSDGAVIAQDDGAERWISTALGSDKNGPAGLLWVRQGAIGLDPDTRDETVKQLETRRDLLSSVSGEIDAMTGGRRMDRVMKRVAEELKTLVTATGKPTGEWRALNGEIAQMEAELSELDAQIDKLSTALDARKQAENLLAQLDQPDARAARAAGLAQAEGALEEAKAHAGRVAAAEQAHKLAQIEAQTARGRLDEFLAALERLASAHSAMEASRGALEEVASQTAQKEAAFEVAKAAADGSTAAVTEARGVLDAARKQAAAQAAKARAKGLEKQLQQVDEVEKKRDAARARIAASAATPKWLAAVEEAQNAVAAQTAAVNAQAATLAVTYSGAARVTQGSEVLSDGVPVMLSGSTDFELPGIGSLRVDVPDGGREAADALSARKARLAEVLAKAEAQTLAEARDLAAARAQWVQKLQTAEAVLQTLAPQGTAPLRAEKAAADLAGAGADDAPLPAQDALEAALTKAQAEDAEAQAVLARASASHAAAREAAIHSQAAAQAAQTALEAAQAKAGHTETRDATKADLIRTDAQAQENASAKAEALENMRAQAPDLGTAQAECTRAQNAVTAAEGQLQKLQLRIAALSAEIHAQSEAGIEETRDTLSGRLDAARAKEARLANKAAALLRLRAALEAERSAARDTYFGPVQRELAPLLSILYDEAGLQFDTDSLLPSGLTRAQTEERLDDLSGGTQEQIAILTRLAFARLFQGQGRHMPIVLDDALVYSDDARIVKMFTALTRVAQEQQILVFTCRTMAFLELGGTRPEVDIHDL